MTTIMPQDENVATEPRAIWMESEANFLSNTADSILEQAGLIHRINEALSGEYPSIPVDSAKIADCDDRPGLFGEVERSRAKLQNAITTLTEELNVLQSYNLV